MKNINPFFRFVSYLAISLLLVCCQNDDLPQVDSAPEFSNVVQDIASLPGQTFTIQATITDPAGIKSIALEYEPWFLDRTIHRDSITQTYQLNYSFKVPDDAIEGTSHTILLTAENIGGVTTTQEVTVTLNADIEGPVVTVNSPANAATILMGDGDEIVFDLNLTDNQQLSELVVASSLLTETVPLTGNSYNYTNSINIDTPGQYTFDFTVTDMAGNSTMVTRSVNVVAELSFLQMYLADTDNSNDLTSSLAGYPYTTTPSTVSGEQGLVFSIRYYAEHANTGVRFIAQKTGFGPYAFGSNGSSDGVLVIGTDVSVAPITLPSIGYYDIKMSLVDLTYTVTPLGNVGAPNISGFTGLYATGTGMSINGQNIDQYNPAAAAPLTVDPVNPYRYSATITFNAASGSFIFVGNQENWNVFWRVNNGPIATTTAIVPQGGTECGFDTQYSGSYKLTVDLYLNTFRITQL